MFQARLFFVVVILCALVGVALGQRKLEQIDLLEQTDFERVDLSQDRREGTREQVLASYERRREHLQKLVARHKEEVADHENGRRLLEDEEYDKLTRRIDIFGKKLERMEDPMDEREINRAIERTKMRNDRRHMDL